MSRRNKSASAEGTGIGLPIAVIGVGGIGSHFCALLNWALHKDQLEMDSQDITIYDFDVVDESNLRHQDYYRNTIGFPKAFVIATRYGFHGRCVKFGEQPDHFNDNQTFIICADNPGVRMAINEHCREARKSFIDMRSEGDMYTVMTDLCPVDKYLASLGTTDEERKDENGRSCQLAQDKEAGQVQLGHLAAAVAGMQVLLKRVRKQSYPQQFIAAVA